MVKFPFRVSPPAPQGCCVLCQTIIIHLPETNLPDSMSLKCIKCSSATQVYLRRVENKKVKAISNKPSYHCQVRLANPKQNIQKLPKLSLSKSIQRKLWKSRLNTTNRAQGLATCPSQIAARRLPQRLAHGFNRQLRACCR